MHSCHFCGAGAPGNYAVTSLKGNPKRIGSWRRHVLAACPRCHPTGYFWLLGCREGSSRRLEKSGTPGTGWDGSTRRVRLLPVDTRPAQARNTVAHKRSRRKYVPEGGEQPFNREGESIWVG